MKNYQSLLKMVIGLISLMAIFTFSAWADAPNDASQTPPEANRSMHTLSLAASCAACHGTNGNPVPSVAQAKPASPLAGIKPDYFVQQMRAFASFERPATVMHHHAKGLTPQEIDDLADYFSKKKPQAAQVAPHEKLKKDE